MTDVVVAGGGPAGCAAAVGLAGLGYEVTLIHRPSRAPRFEGFSIRTLDALIGSGLSSAARCASPALERSVHWGAWRGAVNREHLVDRAALDRAALRDARAAGVTLLSAHLRSARLERETWHLVAADADRAPRRIRAAWLIEARGRSAPRSGRGERGISTLALARRFRSDSGTSGAWLATWREGFAWACAHGGAGVLQLFVDPARRWRGALEEGFEATLRALRDETPAFFEDLGPFCFEGPVAARDATPRCAAEVAPRRVLRLGDAAAAVDPLSGNGVFWALASARAALPVFQTLTRRPAAADLARRFFRERVAYHYRHQAEIGAAFYAADTRHSRSPFFARRRPVPAPPDPTHQPPGRIEIRPVVVDGFVEEREVWVSPAHPLGIWRSGSGELVPPLRAREPLTETPGLEQSARDE